MCATHLPRDCPGFAWFYRGCANRWQIRMPRGPCACDAFTMLLLGSRVFAMICDMIATRLPCASSVVVLRLPSVWHAFAQRLPSVRYAFAMRLPCVCNAPTLCVLCSSLRFPRSNNAFATRLPGLSTRLPCVCHALAKRVPCV